MKLVQDLEGLSTAVDGPFALPCESVTDVRFLRTVVWFSVLS